LRVGLLGERAVQERDLAAAARVMRTNYEGSELPLGEIANRFWARGTGRPSV
jgi:hypothetical protein